LGNEQRIREIEVLTDKNKVFISISSLAFPIQLNPSNHRKTSTNIELELQS
jgi:hypothetical protein